MVPDLGERYGKESAVCDIYSGTRPLLTGLPGHQLRGALTETLLKANCWLTRSVVNDAHQQKQASKEPISPLDSGPKSGDTSLGMQARLCVSRSGSSCGGRHRSHARIIAATNRNLGAGSTGREFFAPLLPVERHSHPRPHCGGGAPTYNCSFSFYLGRPRSCR